MGEKKAVALALICVVLAAGLATTTFMLFQKDGELQITNDQLSELETEKTTLEDQVADQQNETDTLETQLAALQTEKLALAEQIAALQTQNTTLNNQILDLQAQIASLQTENSTLASDLADLQAQVVTLQNQKANLLAQISALETEIDTLEEQVLQSYADGYADGESDGYDTGYDDGYLDGVAYVTANGTYLIHPTYSQAMAFTSADTTDSNPYVMPTYVCYDFSSDFIANAKAAGYQCGFVYIEYASSAHAVVSFNTTDTGLIYIEPQNDNIVTLTIGQKYLGDTIVDISIIW